MIQIINGDCRDILPMLPAGSVQCCVTSPPYFGLRDYGVDGQIGLEPTPSEFVAALVEVFREVRRVLADDGTLWLNLGDSYAPVNYGAQSKRRRDSAGSTDTLQGKVGHWHSDRDGQRSATMFRGARDEGYKQKDLMGIPWRVAFALQADGWYLRQDIIWHKPNPMPESVRDRCTKAHEYIFMLTKSERYFFDGDAIKEPAVSDHPSGNGFKRDARMTYQNADGTARGNDQQWTDIGGTRNRRSVWTVTTKPFKGAHFATFPPDLIEPCVLAGSRPGDTVLDPFGGAGTTGLVAQRCGRRYVGIELNPEYVGITKRRLGLDVLEDMLA